VVGTAGATVAVAQVMPAHLTTAPVAPTAQKLLGSLPQTLVSIAAAGTVTALQMGVKLGAWPSPQCIMVLPMPTAQTLLASLPHTRVSVMGLGPEPRQLLPWHLRTSSSPLPTAQAPPPLSAHTSRRSLVPLLTTLQVGLPHCITILLAPTTQTLLA